MEKFLLKTAPQQRVYALAFVLNAKSVLASRAPGVIQDALDQILKSVTQPSFDHLNIYICMLFALSFIGYFVYSSQSTKVKFCDKQLLLSDIVDNSEAAANKDAEFHRLLD
jgi:hypothetical protein